MSWEEYFLAVPVRVFSTAAADESEVSMDTVYDAKGKFFTDFVTKGKVRIILQTGMNRIEGNFHLKSDHRIIDALNNPKSFLALTDVVVNDPEGKEQYHSDFLTVNKDHIQWVLPLEDAREETLNGENN